MAQRRLTRGAPLRIDLFERRPRPARDGQPTLAILWGWRLEIALFAAVFLGHLWMSRIVGTTGAAVVVVLATTGLLLWPKSRNLILRRLHVASVRRAWARTQHNSGGNIGWRISQIKRIEAGDQLIVKAKRTGPVTKMEDREDDLATHLRVREVRVVRDRKNAARATVTLIRTDPFDDPTPIAWPNLAAERLNLWDPIDLGIDEEGQPVRISLAERNLLIGGEPGAGKSQALSLLASHCALDPESKLWILDGKRVELAAWAPVTERLVGPDGKDAIECLKQLQSVMDIRYRDLLARGLRKVTREDHLPLHLVLIDELAFYMQLPDVKKRNELTELLRDLVARGRAAGIIVVAATQKPDHKMVPTALRDLFGFSLALRCNTPQASDTILGQGWSAAGTDASDIPGAQRGVGYLLAEGERPFRLRGYFLGDAEVVSVASRAAALRAESELQAMVSSSLPS